MRQKPEMELASMVTALPNPPTARQRFRAGLRERATPAKTLSVREFAEQYVMLPPTSPFGSVPFSCGRQPYVGLLFDELDSGQWKTVVISGPSQSGKTLSSFVIPILRDVKELKLNTVAAFPEADMASDKWDTDFLPTLEHSPDLRHLVPQTGPGSRGGRIRDRVSLGNGVDIKVMSRGGKDTAKAGYTSPRVYVTEAAGWSHSAEASSEANPLRQLRARSKAFKRKDPRRCLVVEGTLTIESELPWSARGDDDDDKLISTRSRILAPCPHCGEWMLPERKHLVGWQNAESEDEAANEAQFIGPCCGQPIDDAQRAASVASGRLVHHGQSVDAHGEVVGEPPATSTLWFHWEGWHNLLRDAGDFAAAEWEAAQIEPGTEERENAEKELCQFDWSVPFKSTLINEEPLRAARLRQRTEGWKRNLIPHDTLKLTFGIDLGDWDGWPVGIAHREGGQRHVPTYGRFQVKRSKRDHLETRIVQSLHEYFDALEEGFPTEGRDGLWMPDVVWVDGGYMPNEVAQCIRDRGGIRQKRYWLVRGRGSSTNNGSYRHPPALRGRVVMIGNQWYGEVNYDRKLIEITFNADFWKHRTADALKLDAGRKGAMTLFQPDSPRDIATITKHWSNEQFRRVWEPGKGPVDKWVVTGDQHLNDATVMAMGAADMAGINVTKIVEQASVEAVQAAEPEQPRAIKQQPASNWCEEMLG